MGLNRRRKRVTLSPFGRNKYFERTQERAFSEMREEMAAPPVPPPSKFDWGNAFTDGGIIAGLTFFTTLGGVSLVKVDLASTFGSAAISAVAQFFLMLAIKRGLRKE